jgi:hypothetical protein
MLELAVPCQLWLGSVGGGGQDAGANKMMPMHGY